MPERVLDAVSNGCICCCLKNDAINYCFPDSNSIFFYDSYDKMISKMNEIINMESLEKISEKNRKKVQQSYSVESVIQAFSDIFKRGSYDKRF